MPGFADCLGRKWDVRLTVADLKPLKEAGLDCAALMTSLENLPDMLFGDAERLATALYRLAKPDITPDEFAAGMDGPTLEAGGVALIEACVDFFPRSRIAAAMKGRIREGLAAMDEKLVSLLTTSGGGAGSSAASPASTPAA